MSEAKPNQQKLLQFQQSQTSQLTNNENNPDIFNSLWEYIFSIVGLTVGFGSFWRFPYLIYRNGGGVFLIPYLVAIVVVGIPILYLQTALGQMHRASLPFILKRIHPALKMLGVAILINSLHLSSVYNILMTYSYRFIFSSFNPNLPFSQQEITDSKYFQETILTQSKSIQDFQAINPQLFIIYVFSLLVCHYIIKNGVKASGKIVTFTATAPFFFFAVLLIRGLFLSGAGKGLQYLFEPKWQKLWSGSIWADAMVQVFYQLSLGLGCLFSISSMKPRRQQFLKGVLIVPASILLCGLLSAITVFIYLSHFCLQMGMQIDDPKLHLSGPQLSFNVFPKALATLPLPNLWIFIFFIAMVLLGIDSLFGMMEAIYCYVRDQFKDGPMQMFGIQISFQKSKYMVLGLIMIGCPSLTSHAGIYYLQFYDYYISNIPYTLAVVFELYFFVYLFKFQQLENMIVKYTGQKTPYIIRFFLESKILILLLGVNLLIAIFQQLCSFRRFSFDFYLIGWGITLYPLILSYIYFKKHWTCKQDLKLTFYALEHRPSHL